MTGQPRRRVVLVFSEPGHGPCYLVEQLRDAYGYEIVYLDQVYVDFVAACYPDYHMPGLRSVAMPHYQILMRHLAGTGAPALASFFPDWAAHAVAVVVAAARRHPRVVVEGWMLLPAPGAIRERLAGIATVTVVEACNGQACSAHTVARIHHDADAPFHPHR
jgi:hypothetical protein